MILSHTLLTLTLSVSGALAAICECDFPRIIRKDVAVIGGGASGTYAAVRLREDFNTSIILIEPEARLGGHVNTYLDPETNTTLEYGVESYMRNPEGTNFFQRFGVGLTPFVAPNLTSINVDVKTGQLLKDYAPPSSHDANKAFQRWLAIVEKYEHYMEPGYWKFPFPDAIPNDLVTPFGEFARRNYLEAAVPRILDVSGEGIGGISGVLTFSVVRKFGAAISRALVENSFFVPNGSNSLVYQRAYELLKQDVLLSTTVKQVERSPSGAKLVVKTKDGEQLIIAKRILYSAPPSLAYNLKPFDLDKNELDVFRTWTNDYLYIGLLEVPCIPENYSVSYLSSAAVPSNHLAIKEWPYSLRLDSTRPSGANLFRLVFGANYSIQPEQVKATVKDSVQKLVDAGTFKADGACNVTFITFENHNGIIWRQTSSSLKRGFVQKLYALQGYQATWYTGYTWASPYSSTVWAYTETVLPQLLASLGASTANTASCSIDQVRQFSTGYR